MRIFGPSKEEVWKGFSEEVSGVFYDGGVRDSWWEGESGVLLSHKGLEIKFDTYQDVFDRMLPQYTRIRTRYRSSNPLNFTIRHKTWIDLLIGLRPGYFVKTGDTEFDWGFSCRASEKSVLRALLSFSIIRHLVKEISTLELKSRDKEGWGIFSNDFPNGTLELYLRIPGVEKDCKKLRLLYHLFTEVLDRLAEIGARTEVR